MIFISIDDFYEKAAQCHVLSREEEVLCARRMKDGDNAAREQLIQSYLPMLARYMKGRKPHMQTLGLVLYCRHALEKAVDSFDFSQDREPFSHRLNWAFRQAAVNYIVR